MAIAKTYKPDYIGSDKSFYTPPSKAVYFMNYYEWLKEQGTEIIYGKEAVNNVVIYSVPVGYTLYLTSVSISAFYDSLAGSVSLRISAAGDETICFVWVTALSQNGNMVTAFEFPMKIRENNDLLTLKGNGVEGIVGFTGFLVPNNL